MFLRNAAFFVEPPSRHCQTRATTTFFLSHLVTGWFRGYCIWLDSNIVLSPARGWPHMGVLEEGENQEAFPYLIAFLVITYPWQPSALGSPPCSPTTEQVQSCAGSRGTYTTAEGKGNDRVSCPLSPGKKRKALTWVTVYTTSFQVKVLPFTIIE